MMRASGDGSAAAAAATAEQPVIMVYAEDDNATFRVHSKKLSAAYPTVPIAMARDGEQAKMQVLHLILEQREEPNPSRIIVVSDIDMPNMSGRESAWDIRKSGVIAPEEQPVYVFCTGGNDKDRETLIQAPYYAGFISKDTINNDTTGKGLVGFLKIELEQMRGRIDATPDYPYPHHKDVIASFLSIPQQVRTRRPRVAGDGDSVGSASTTRTVSPGAVSVASTDRVPTDSLPLPGMAGWASPVVGSRPLPVHGDGDSVGSWDSAGSATGHSGLASLFSQAALVPAASSAASRHPFASFGAAGENDATTRLRRDSRDSFEGELPHHAVAEGVLAGVMFSSSQQCWAEAMDFSPMRVASQAGRSPDGLFAVRQLSFSAVVGEGGLEAVGASSFQQRRSLSTSLGEPAADDSVVRHRSSSLPHSRVRGDQRIKDLPLLSPSAVVVRQ